MTDLQFDPPVDPADQVADHPPAWALQAGESVVRALHGRPLAPFPAVPSAQATGRAATPTAKPVAALAGLRVLAIGNAGVRHVAREGGAGLGLRVEVAAAGRDAVRAVRRARLAHQPFAVVLLDAEAPGADALACAGHLVRAARGTGAIALLTAPVGRDALARRVLEGGAAIGAVVALPLTAAALAETCLALGGLGTAALSSAVHPGRQALGSLPNRRILLVDDSPIDAELTIHCLQEAGHAVAWAHDALEALAILEAEVFDAVLMDSRLPGMDGYEAARAIRGRFDDAALPVIGLSADGMLWDRERACAAGMNEQVGKPVDPWQLLDVLTRCLGR